jgi:hypothetical protein
MERFPDKQTAKLQKVLARLSRGEIVQNRQLKTVLGTEGYARYFSDCEYQKHLRAMLKDKPDEIIEYERRLKAATFAHSKADYKSQKGHRSAKKMFGASDTQFERLSDGCCAMSEWLHLLRRFPKGTDSSIQVSSSSRWD